VGAGDADAGDADAGGALVFARVERELDERCDPKKHPASETSKGFDPESNPGLKFTAVWVGTCMRDLVEHEVDAARTRLRATSAAAARVRELAAAGGAARREIDQMRSRGQALWPRAPTRDDGKTYPVSPLSKEDLRQVISFAAEADRGARALARSTCAWEALAVELGGKQACARDVELYYLAHWSEEPIR
jgi:hypothetical protein